MSKNIRNLPGNTVQDPSIISNLEYNDAAGSSKVSEVGRHLLPIPYISAGALAYTTDASGTVGSQTISPVADTAGSLAGTYFLLQSQSGNKYAVWFKVSGTGSAPVVAGYTPEEVDISTGATAAAVGTALASVISGLNNGNDFSAAGTTTVTVTNRSVGVFTPASDVNTGFAFGGVSQGTGSARVLPNKGLCLAIYNKDTTVHSVTLGENGSAVLLSAGQTDSSGHVGIPCQPSAWSYIACSTQNWVTTDSNQLVVFIIDDNTSIVREQK